MNAAAQEIGTSSLIIVEDDLGSRLLLQREFEASRYKLTVAANVTDASESLQLGQFDLGIFDLRLPSTDDDLPTTQEALSLIKMARDANPAMVIITISSVYVDESLRQKLSGLNVIKNFEKPFSLDKLRSLVETKLVH